MQHAGGAPILVVEDDAATADALAQRIADATGRVLGPFATVAAARAAIKSGAEIGAAVLDIKLGGGEVVTPILEALRARRVPVIVCSGSDLPGDVARRHPDLLTLKKPIAPARIVAELKRLFRR